MEQTINHRNYTITTSDGKEAIASQVQQMMEAMATFTASNTDALSIPEQMHQFTRMSNIAAGWSNQGG